jgi:hypothetical protein
MRITTPGAESPFKVDFGGFSTSKLEYQVSPPWPPPPEMNLFQAKNLVPSTAGDLVNLKYESMTNLGTGPLNTAQTPKLGRSKHPQIAENVKIPKRVTSGPI